jgi:hypothetical protein
VSVEVHRHIIKGLTYSTPISSKACAILILVAVSK